MIRRLRVTAPLLALAVGVVVAATAPAAAAPAARGAAPNRAYVALGDSYAAGYALAPPAAPTGVPVPGCEQTTRDYPHQVAAALNLQLTDVACSRAVVADLRRPQGDLAGGGIRPPAQLDALAAVHPRLVTLTIGQGDLGLFYRIVNDCLALAPTGQLFNHPTYRTCEDYYASTEFDGGKIHNPFDNLPSVLAAVRGAIRDVRAAAPQARVVVVGYPALVPDAANTPADGCYRALIPENGGLLPSALPIVDSDVIYLHELQRRFDVGLVAAARAAGASVADLYPASLAHSSCSSPATRWVEPIVAADHRTMGVAQPTLLGTREMAIGVIRTVVQGS